MSAPWEAEQAVALDVAERLVAEQLPDLAGLPVEPLAVGWDNTVLLVGDVVLRFPRRAVAVELQARETAVLRAVAGRLPLAVPVPTHTGTGGHGYPWPFWGARLIEGRELHGLPEAAREPAGEQLGAFLRALHDLRVDVDLPVDPTQRADPAARVERAQAWLDELAGRGLWSGSREVDALLSAALGPSTAPPVLVHGDLHLRHLLVDDDGRAAGVIDWGDTCRADPSLDLSLVYAGFTGRARQAALSAYGPVDAEREHRARSLGVFLCAALAAHSAAVGDPALPEHLAGIVRSVS